jgi:hypothetical protein
MLGGLPLPPSVLKNIAQSGRHEQPQPRIASLAPVVGAREPLSCPADQFCRAAARGQGDRWLASEDGRPMFFARIEVRGRGGICGRLCPASLRSRRDLPVRLKPRDRGDRRRDDHGEGGTCPPVSQPDAVRACLSSRDAGDGLLRKAFAFFGGTCTRGIYDNMKTAVDTIFVGRDRAYSRRFQQMYGHYLVDPVACTPASG